MVPACSLTNVAVAYHDHVVLRETNLTVPPGTSTGIVGPNGAGKSTLLKAAMGLLPLLVGEVRFAGQPLDKVRQRVAYMPQANAVDWDFPTTVSDVVLMGTYGNLGWFKRPGRDQRHRADHAMAEVGITDLANRPIGQLSGGQRQRVFLARALAQDADVYLMDEAFAGVDAASEQAIAEVLRHLRSQGRTLIVVHHDLSTLERFCDRVALIKGTVVAEGPLTTTFTADLVAEVYGVPALSSPAGAKATACTTEGESHMGVGT